MSATADYRGGCSRFKGGALLAVRRGHIGQELLRVTWRWSLVGCEQWHTG
jgi:hypothetical protein